ncbi:MAG: hypothetical protein LBV41_01770 [Cytophagaceae bacterium]|nr:hypothetical protein [Cytophagaceae bacterium]
MCKRSAAYGKQTTAQLPARAEQIRTSFSAGNAPLRHAQRPARHCGYYNRHLRKTVMRCFNSISTRST